MSTILKAVQELEGRTAPSLCEPAVATSHGRERLARATGVWLRVTAILGAGAALLAGVAVQRMRSGAVDAPRKIDAAPAARAIDAAPAPLSPSAQKAVAPATIDPAPVAITAATSRSAAAPASALAAADAAPRVDDAPRADMLPSTSTRPPRTTAALEPAPAPRRETTSVQHRTAPERAPREGAPVANGPSIQVTAISYSADVAGRSAMLRIDGRATTLRQGDSVGGVQVQLIMPDAVYLRRGSEIFAVDVNR